MKENFEYLIKGTSSPREINPHITFKYLDKDEDSIWALLLHTGYLTAIKQEMNQRDRLEITFAIPNREVMMIFETVVERWFKGVVDKQYADFLRFLEQGKMPEFFAFIAEYVRISGSYFDFGKKTPEKVFHALMLGIFVGLKHAYKIDSNKEAGFGRYDVILKPKIPQKRGIILEFKVCTKKADLKKSALSAIQQIKETYYTDAFDSGEILLVGIAFWGKEVHGEYEIIQLNPAV